MNVQEAFDVLLSELQNALEQAQAQIAQAVSKAHYAEVQAAAQKAEQIQKQLNTLQQMRQSWPSSVDAKPARRRPGRPKKKPERLHRGEKFTDKEFRLPLLQALVQLGGSASTKQTLDQVGELVQGQLKPADYEILSDGRTIRWRNTAAWARQQLVEEGLMKNDSPNGVWEITEQGRKYVEQSSKP